jgi:pseudaminic acid biosynthesis-associated methylase
MQTTRQLEHWRGAFGDDYSDRNPASEERIQQSTKFWAGILGRINPPRSILEVGANVGANLLALRRISSADLFAVEPNDRARSRLIASVATSPDRIFAAAAQNIPLQSGCVDLAFAEGVLIHISPDDLLAACSEIHRCSRKYILCMEYFSDQPEEKHYRGHSGLLFKRDFGAFYLENFRDLEVIDCGFAWRPLTGIDNQTWWLFRKT